MESLDEDREVKVIYYLLQITRRRTIDQSTHFLVLLSLVVFTRYMIKRENVLCKHLILFTR